MDGEGAERVDEDELLGTGDRSGCRSEAPPDPRVWWYANAARAKGKRDSDGGASNPAPAAASGSLGPMIVASGDASDEAERRAARRRWADLIRRICKVDPLVCPNCGGPMKIVAFITDRKVIRAILASMRKGPAPASPAGSRPQPPLARPAGDAGP